MPGPITVRGMMHRNVERREEAGQRTRLVVPALRAKAATEQRLRHLRPSHLQLPVASIGVPDKTTFCEYW